MSYQFEVGVEYKCRNGMPGGVYWIDPDEDKSHGWYTLGGRRSMIIRHKAGWFTFDIEHELDLMPPEPEQPARPPLDLSKPIIHVATDKIVDDVFFGSLDKITYVLPQGTAAVNIDGYNIDGVQILRQAVAVPWTKDDVPFPWPVFRSSSFKGDRACVGVNDWGIEVLNMNVYPIRETWQQLTRWQYSTDGKTWRECCKWE